MNTPRDFDRIAQAWLADGPVELSDRVFDAAFEEVHLTRQRRVLRVPWRPSTMTSILKLAAAAAAVLVVLLGGSLLLNRGSGPPVGATPSPSPVVTATEAPSPIPTPAVLPASGRVGEGEFTTDLIHPRTTFRLDCCWEVVHQDSGLVVLNEVGLDRYLIITNPDAVLDPATFEAEPLPADLVDWLANHPGLEVGTPREVSLGGLSGREVEAAPLPDANYTPRGEIFLTGSLSSNRTMIQSHHRVRFIVLDGPDGPVMIHVLARSDTFEEFAPKAQAVLDSLRFGD